MLTGWIHLALGATLLGPVQYRIEYHLNQVEDFSQLGGPQRESSKTFVAFVTVTERDSAGSRIAELRFDSVQAAEGNLATAAPETVKGLVYRATIANGQTVGKFFSSQRNTLVDPVVNHLSAIFPGFRPNAKVGDVRTDTLIYNDSIPNLSKGTTITAWAVDSLTSGNVTMTGSFTTIGETVRLVADGTRYVGQVTGSGSRHLTGPAGGGVITGKVSSKQELVVTAPDGKSYPVTTQQTITITQRS